MAHARTSPTRVTDRARAMRRAVALTMLATFVSWMTPGLQPAARADFTPLGGMFQPQQTQFWGRAVAEEAPEPWFATLTCTSDLQGSGWVPTYVCKTGDVYAYRWTGAAWVTVGGGRIDGTEHARSVRLDVSGTFALAAWSVDDWTSETDTPDARAKAWNGSSWVALGTRVNTNPANSAYLGDAKIVGGQYIVAVREDDGTGNLQGLVRQWNGSAWTTLGAVFDSLPGDVRTIDLANDAGSVVATISEDDGTGTTWATTYRWSGAAWVQLGVAVATSSTDLGRDSTGIVRTTRTGGGVEYARWTGAAWSQVTMLPPPATTEFSTGGAAAFFETTAVDDGTSIIEWTGTRLRVRPDGDVDASSVSVGTSAGVPFIVGQWLKTYFQSGPESFSQNWMWVRTWGSWQDEYTFVPDGDTGTTAQVGVNDTTCSVVAPSAFWSLVADDVDTPYEFDCPVSATFKAGAITTTASPTGATVSVTLSDAPTNLPASISPTIRIRSHKAGGKTTAAQVQLYRDAGTAVGSAAAYAPTTSWATYSHAPGAVSLTKAQLDTLYATWTASVSGGGSATNVLLDELDVDIAYTPAATYPYLPTGRWQYGSNGSNITFGASIGGSAASPIKLGFSVGDVDAGDLLTPWVEVQPLGTPFSGTCGAAGPNMYSGAPVTATVAGERYPAQVDVNGLAAGSYVWRACVVDAAAHVAAWLPGVVQPTTADFTLTSAAGSNGAPWAPVSLDQFRDDATTQITPGSWTPDGATTNVVLTFDGADPDVAQTLTPWVEVRPIGDALSASCGAAVPGVTFSGTPIAAPTADVAVSLTVSVTGLTSGVEYHWRACTVDQSAAPSAWTEAGGTPDFAVDSVAPPASTLVTPANGATGSGIPTLTATYSDTAPGSPGSLEFQACDVSDCSSVIDSGTSGVSLAATGENASWDPSVGAATLWWRARSIDAAGNVGPWSAIWSYVQTGTLTVSIDTPTLDLGGVEPLVDRFGSLVVTVVTDNAPGYQLFASDASDTVAATCACGGSVLDWTGTGAIPTLWTASTPGGIGITVRDAPGGRLAKWGAGTGTAESDTTSNLYAGLETSTSALLHQRSSATAGDDVTTTLRLNSPATTQPGSYGSTLTITATANP